MISHSFASKFVQARLLQIGHLIYVLWKDPPHTSKALREVYKTKSRHPKEILLIWHRTAKDMQMLIGFRFFYIFSMTKQRFYYALWTIKLLSQLWSRFLRSESCYTSFLVRNVYKTLPRAAENLFLNHFDSVLGIKRAGNFVLTA